MSTRLEIAVLLLLSLSAAGPAYASVASCDGLVFEDRDGDGHRAAGERPLPGVAVSNGDFVLRTGADGTYAFPEYDGRAVFVIKPAGYTLPRRDDGLPGFWYAAGPACADFALRPDPRPAGELRVLLFSDTQTRNPQEVDYYSRGIVDAVRALHARQPGPAGAPETYEPGSAGDLGLTLGDVANDNPAMYPALNASTTRLGVPWLHAPGNHDVDVAATTDAESLHSFARVYGPDTYAWEEHEAVFIVLDDVVWQPGVAPKYIGGLREDQFRFLEQYLEGLDFQKRVVIAAHMPFFDDKPGIASFRPADRERLFALLQRFDQVLLLTGHGHVQRHHFHDATTGWHGAGPLHEYNVGAACGSYWSGVAAADGIPVSTMADGTPKGWAEMTIREHGDYSLRWNVAEAGTDPGTAIALHVPRVLRRGSWPGVGVYANIFMEVAEARVEFRIDDGDWTPMLKVDRADPRLVAENLADDAADALRAYDRLPEAEVSSHLWRGALPTNLVAGEHRVEVRAYDLWRGEVTASTTYRLQDVPTP